MSNFIEFLKIVVFGLVEGFTEWLPISSTGHLILVENIVHLNASAEFMKVFRVVIQLGAIMAVVVLYFNRLNPWAPGKKKNQQLATWHLWIKILIACLPAAVVGLLLDEVLDTYLYNPYVVAAMLIIYGILFIVLEKHNEYVDFPIKKVSQISYRTALYIGLFQLLALIPGTSRSGSTILGAIILGVGRAAGAEFSFFLAIPTMLGASVLKLVKFLLSGVSATGAEWAILAVGCVVSFVVSLLVIKGLMEYVRKHSFAVFGVYRIILGVLVLGYFAFQTLHA